MGEAPMPTDEELVALMLQGLPKPVQAAAPQLADVDPYLLLSQQARSEIVAVESRGAGFDSFLGTPGQVPNVELSSIWDPQRPDYEDATSPDADPDLEALLSGGAGAEVALQQLAARLQAGPLVEPEPFDFGDDDFDAPGPRMATPNQRVRFQIGREDPPPRPSIGRASQAQDGVVVGQRQGGRFTPTRTIQEVRAEARAPRPEPAPRVAAPARPAPAPAAQPAPRTSGKTYYDHLSDD